MNMFVVYSTVCLFLALFTYGSQGATYFEKDAQDLNDPLRCYSSAFDQKLIINRPYLTPDCGRMICDRNFVISYATCGVIGIPKGCVQTPGNLKLPYPRCCPSFSCENSVFNDDEEKEFSMVM